MNELRILLGSTVRRLRVERGLTQSQLAEAIGRSTDLVSRIERGESAPSFETIEKLSEVLGAKPSALFGDGHESSVEPPIDPRINEIVRGMSETEVQWAVDLLKVAHRKPE